MTQQEVTNSFIYHKWYEEDPLIGYNLTNDYGNMLMNGYGELFKFTDKNNFIPPYQITLCYCINSDGYLKVFRLPTNYIPDCSINDMLKNIKEYCIKNKLKFISLFSTKYNYLWLIDFLGNDLNYEYNDKGETKLYI